MEAIRTIMVHYKSERYPKKDACDSPRLCESHFAKRKSALLSLAQTCITMQGLVSSHRIPDGSWCTTSAATTCKPIIRKQHCRRRSPYSINLQALCNDCLTLLRHLMPF